VHADLSRACDDRVGSACVAGGGAVALRTEQLEPAYSDALSASVLSQCSFLSNRAHGGAGGALWVHSVDHGGEHACTACVFHLNAATSTSLDNSTASAEAVSGHGGAVYAASHSVVRPPAA
jgi:hypothetical protein